MASSLPPDGSRPSSSVPSIASSRRISDPCQSSAPLPLQVLAFPILKKWRVSVLLFVRSLAVISFKRHPYLRCCGCGRRPCELPLLWQFHYGTQRLRGTENLRCNNLRHTKHSWTSGRHKPLVLRRDTSQLFANVYAYVLISRLWLWSMSVLSSSFLHSSSHIVSLPLPIRAVLQFPIHIRFGFNFLMYVSISKLNWCKSKKDRCYLS